MSSSIEKMIKASNEIGAGIKKEKKAKSVPRPDSSAAPSAAKEDPAKTSVKDTSIDDSKSSASTPAVDATEQEKNKGGRKALPESEKRKQYSLTMKESMHEDIMARIGRMNKKEPVRRWSFADLAIDAIYEYFDNHHIE